MWWRWRGVEGAVAVEPDEPHWTSPAPRGYRAKDGRWITNENEEEVVARLRAED